MLKFRRKVDPRNLSPDESFTLGDAEIPQEFAPRTRRFERKRSRRRWPLMLAAPALAGLAYGAWQLKQRR